MMPLVDCGEKEMNLISKMLVNNYFISQWILTL
jgi:hypothetical protein